MCDHRYRCSVGKMIVYYRSGYTHDIKVSLLSANSQIPYRPVYPPNSKGSLVREYLNEVRGMVSFLYIICLLSENIFLFIF